VLNKELSNLIFYKNYSKIVPGLSRKETFEEMVQRIIDMHFKHITDTSPFAFNDPTFNDLFLKATAMLSQGLVFGSQRANQFGGQPILNKNMRLYNCSATYVDRPRVFAEIMHTLLCGAGVGISVQKRHVAQIPTLRIPDEKINLVTIDDSIEGWADAIDSLIMSYILDTGVVKFDYSNIRLKGAPISGGFLAPGPDKLMDSIEKIRKILQRVASSYKSLKTIDAFSIVCHIANAVISGGVRRSALITLFDNDDEDMLRAKTGNWFYENPHFARSNNSAYFLRNSDEDKARFKEFQKFVKEYGEPGFIFVDDKDVIFNPCVEINMYPKHWETGESGWQVCNLTTIPMNRIKTRHEFLDACEASAVIGTIQASYTDFAYLGKVSEEIIRHEALLGCSMTGIMNNWGLVKDPDLLQDGANIIKNTNKLVSKVLSINQAARTTCIKPEGNSSALVGSSSGGHGEHSPLYLRRVQVNKEEEVYEFFKKQLPQAVEDSVWGTNDAVITIPMTAPENSVFKNSLVNIEQLEVAKFLKKYWIDPGKNVELCVVPSLSHNVSITVEVTEDGWDKVFAYIWKNKDSFAGISLIPKLGDIIYPQAPFSAVLKPTTLAAEYGDGAIFSSGLIVDINHEFGSLWKALDAFRGQGEKLFVDSIDIDKFFSDYNLDISLDLKYKDYLQSKNDYRQRLKTIAVMLEYDDETIEKLVDTGLPPFKKDVARYLNERLHESITGLASKRDILRRIQKFADKYFDGNTEKMEECLKRVQNYKDWCDITRAYKPLDWDSVEWKNLIEADTTGAVACSGSKCEII